ncbi:MAG: outer membrane beta-barrel protein [Acidobacteriota bacterium]
MRNWVLACLAGAWLAAPALVHAQGVGVGPRLSFVRGDARSPDGSATFSGAGVRLGSGTTALEVSIDYRSSLNDDLSQRIKDTPIQASLLVFPVRSTLSPYLLGGVGWFTQRIQQLGAGEAVLTDTTTRKMGYHAGLGAEIRIGRRIGVYGDYRYTFLRFGADQPGPVMADARPGATSAPNLIPFGERLRLSHQGSMWSWGLNVYF